MRKTAMRCERVTMTFPFTRRMGLLIETGSILTGLCEENLINHCGDSHGERGMIRITSYKMCWAEIRAGSTRRRGGSVEFGHDGEYQRGKVPVSHADRFGMCTSFKDDLFIAGERPINIHRKSIECAEGRHGA